MQTVLVSIGKEFPVSKSWDLVVSHMKYVFGVGVVRSAQVSHWVLKVPF